MIVGKLKERNKEREIEIEKIDIMWLIMAITFVCRFTDSAEINN
jgi:hypothetical protein